MPARTVRHIVAIENGQGQDNHVKITLELELNINLNSDGLQATVTAKDVKSEQVVSKDEPVNEDDGFGGFIVPTFEPSTEKIGFGKRVNAEEAKTVEDTTFLKNKNRLRKEEESKD